MSIFDLISFARIGVRNMSGLVGHSGKTGNLGQIGSGEILIQDTVVNSGATLIMDNVFSGEFRNYNVVCSDMLHNQASNSIKLLCRFIKEDGTQLSTNSYRAVSGGAEGYSGSQNNAQAQRGWNTGEFDVTPAGGSMNNDAGSGGIQLNMIFHNPFQATHLCRVTWKAGMLRYGGDVAHASTGYCLEVGSASTRYRGFRFHLSSGSFTYGRVSVYGYRSNKDNAII